MIDRIITSVDVASLSPHCASRMMMSTITMPVTVSMTVMCPLAVRPARAGIGFSHARRGPRRYRPRWRRLCRPAPQSRSLRRRPRRKRVTRHVRLREFLVAVEGLALFRHLVEGDDDTAEQRIDEVR